MVSASKIWAMVTGLCVQGTRPQPQTEISSCSHFQVPDMRTTHQFKDLPEICKSIELIMNVYNPAACYGIAGSLSEWPDFPTIISNTPQSYKGSHVPSNNYWETSLHLNHTWQLRLSNFMRTDNKPPQSHICSLLPVYHSWRRAVWGSR